ncbi:MAG: glycosyltransferase family 39 protein [Phycisphaerae bacterium]|nr:glycosyltransferase family 39 protein [Phycisphaerae bacterium]
MSDTRPTHPAHQSNVSAQPCAAPPISRSESVAIIIVLMLAALLRLPGLARVPPAINQDECLRGYDAWCLATTGRDYRGVLLPAYLEAFGPGDYPAASSAYLTAPFVALLGLSPVTVRLPFALAGILTVALLWRWLRREFGVAAGLAGAAALALSPWHQQLSRLAFEGGLTPLLLTIGALLLIGKCGSAGGSFVGGAALGAAMWTYAAPRLLVPLLGAAWLAGAGRRTNDNAMNRPATGAAALARRRRTPLWALAGIVFGAAPMLVALARHPQQVFARTSHVSMWREGRTFDATTLLKQYAAHYDPRRLFGDADAGSSICPTGIDWTLPGGSRLRFGGGFLHWYEAPLLATGLIWIAARARADRRARFLIAWWLLFPLPAALVAGGGPHAMRSIVGLPLMAITVGLGAAWWFERARRRGTGLRRALTVAAAAAALVNAGLYQRYYVSEYPRQAARWFQPDLAGAFTWLHERESSPGARPYDAVLVAFPANQTFAYYLFFTRVPPRLAQAVESSQDNGRRVVRESWIEGFDDVLRWDRVQFAPARQRRPWSEDEIVERASQCAAGARVLILARPGQVRRTRPVAVLTGPDGGPTIEAHEWFVTP